MAAPELLVDALLLVEEDGELLLVALEEELLLVAVVLLLLVAELLPVLLVAEVVLLLLVAEVVLAPVLRVAVPVDPRFTVDSLPPGDFVLMRVSDVPEVFTRLLTVVWVEELELVLACELLAPVEPALRTVFVVPELADVRVVPVDEDALRTDEAEDGDDEVAAVEDAPRVAVVTLVLVEAAWRSRISRAFTIRLLLLLFGMLAVRTENERSGYFLP